MSKRKILYISGTAELGGAEFSLLSLMKHLNRDSFTPRVVLPSDGPLRERLHALDVKTHSLPLMEFSKFHPFLFAKSVLALYQLIKRKGINLVHANSIYVAEESFFASRLSSVSCVCHIRDLVPILGAGKIRSFAFRRMDQLIAISDAVKKDLIGDLQIHKEKILRIYNGVDTEEFNPRISGKNFRDGIKVDGKRLVGIIGRLSPEKGQDVFLHAGAEIVKRFSNVALVIIGSERLGRADFKDRLIGLARELGISNRVIFAGFWENAPEALAALDLLVVPSTREPFGRVIVEAMAMEKPVVASNSGAVPEVLSNECGILASPGDVAGFEVAIIRLLENKRYCEKLGKAGRRIALERFDIRRNALEIEELYRQLLNL